MVFLAYYTGMVEWFTQQTKDLYSLRVVSSSLTTCIICQVGLKVTTLPFQGSNVGFKSHTDYWFGSWLSLRLFGWSNYQSGYSVRNLSGAHEVLRDAAC